MRLRRCFRNTFPVDMPCMWSQTCFRTKKICRWHTALPRSASFRRWIGACRVGIRYTLPQTHLCCALNHSDPRDTVRRCMQQLSYCFAISRVHNLDIWFADQFVQCLDCADPRSILHPCTTTYAFRLETFPPDTRHKWPWISFRPHHTIRRCIPCRRIAIEQHRPATCPLDSPCMRERRACPRPNIFLPGTANTPIVPRCPHSNQWRIAHNHSWMRR